ncbi:hypothetical protein LTR39_001889 [Cryomyces antarcticus]|nr:hypothetical protein LTR39_001889 [Cryomyces antarcticus]
MPLPKLTPLQSRFVASLFAFIILVIICFSLSNPHFTYAADVDSVLHEDHNHHRLLEHSHGPPLVIDDVDWDLEEDDGVVGKVESAARRADEEEKIVGRAPAGVIALDNNIPNNLNINPGETHYYFLSRAILFGKHANKGTGLPSALSGRSHGDAVEDLRELRKREGRPGAVNPSDADVEELVLEKRQETASGTLYVSINTCLQPSYKGSNTDDGSIPPQLTLYVSTSSANQKLGPGTTNSEQQTVPLLGGFANITLNATGDVYISVSAPSLPITFSGGWNYDLAASIDGLYHTFNSAVPFLFLVDSDTSSALLVTDNLTQADPTSSEYNQWMSLSSPFKLFAQNMADPATRGLENSFCGLQNHARIVSRPDPHDRAPGNVQIGMTTRGLGNKPKEQFWIQRLNGSATYYGFLAMEGNSTHSGAGVVGGGGQVWTAMNFTTKTDGNCQVIFNLTFCSEVAYAVPSNPSTYPDPVALSALYDDYAAALYKNFSYSLQQIPCNTTNTAQYSLATNCSACAAAYKTWLCAVSIPRCEDFSRDADWLQPRNVGQRFINSSNNNDNNASSPLTMLPDAYLGAPYSPMTGAPSNADVGAQTYLSALASNSSRNAAVIDDQVMPGPYKEVLPCEDLCYSLARACPAALQFACPLPGRGLELAYGQRSQDGLIRCSYLGAVYYLSGARRVGGGLAGPVAGAVASAVVVVGMLW